MCFFALASWNSIVTNSVFPSEKKVGGFPCVSNSERREREYLSHKLTSLVRTYLRSYDYFGIVPASAFLPLLLLLSARYVSGQGRNPSNIFAFTYTHIHAHTRRHTLSPRTHTHIHTTRARKALITKKRR